jgi:hyperosmotically inducible protein
LNTAWKHVEGEQRKKQQSGTKGKYMQNIKHLVTLGRLSAIIGVASLVGCSSIMPSSSSSKDQRSEGRIKDDKNITEALEKKLKSDPIYKFEQVQVKTYSGTVQLSGFVDTTHQSQRAEEHSRSVAGVTHLINGLAVKPAPAPKVEMSVQTLSPAEMPAPTGKASGEALTPPPGTTSNTSPDSTTKNY